MAETLYREGALSAEQIAQRLHISKSTLYAYPRHRGVPVGVGRPPGETGRPVPRKTTLAESLIDLTRQLVALPARSHERRLAVAEAARGYGVSEPTVYQRIARDS